MGTLVTEQPASEDTMASLKDSDATANKIEDTNPGRKKAAKTETAAKKNASKLQMKIGELKQFIKEKFSKLQQSAIKNDEQKLADTRIRIWIKILMWISDETSLDTEFYAFLLQDDFKALDLSQAAAKFDQEVPKTKKLLLPNCLLLLRQSSWSPTLASPSI